MSLGSALAFGLGGRDAAADLINSVDRRAQQQSDQVQAGQQRAHAEAQQYTQQYAQPGAQPGPRYEDGAAQRPGATEAYRTR